MQPPFKKSTSILGDAMEVLRSLPNASFDACIVDPPYNMAKKKGLAWAFSSHVTISEAWDIFTKDDYFKFSFEWITEVCRIVKPNGNLFMFGTYHNIYTIGFILQHLDRKILNSIIWVKPNAQPNITCRMLTESSEQVIWACNNSQKHAKGWRFQYQDAKKMNGGKQMRNVWSVPLTPRSERVGGHPSQKPESILERIVQISTSPGDWIIDPFAGTGTMGVAAARHDRNFVLIERLPKYITAQKARFKTAGFGAKVAFKTVKPKKRAAAPATDAVEHGATATAAP